MYCTEPEKIENFEKALRDGFTGWCIHHRLETHTSDGECRLVDITPAELKALDMYFNRPPEELIYLTRSEHTALHSEGKKHSEESKKKMSEAKKGKYIGENNPFYGKRHTDETKKKISETNKEKYIGENNPMYGKKHTEESKKKMSEARKGMYIGEDNPFYGKTHSEETRRRLSAAHKGKHLSKEHINKVAEANRGKHWYNNGKENAFCFDCPPGFVPGRLRK